MKIDWALMSPCSIPEITQLPSPLRWFFAVGIPVLIVIKAHNKSLNLSGSVFGMFDVWLFWASLCFSIALITGFVLTLTNYCFATSLLTFFTTSSIATHFKSDRKRRFEDDFETSARRNWIQVVCNGGVATQMALFYLMEAGPLETVIDFTTRYNLSWWAISVLASICCANGDTWASELGSVLSRSDPFLITSFKRVPRGTNGGVTLIGLIVSGLGGLVVAAAFALMLWISIPGEQWNSSPSQIVPLLCIGVFAGLFGSLVDSLLGATLQYSGLQITTGKVVEHSGHGIQYISGRALLDNHSVNLLSNLITALVSPSVAIRLWTYF